MLRILFLAFLGGFCHLFIKSAKATFVYMLWTQHTKYSENIIIDIKIYLAIRYFLKICNFCQKMESKLIFVRILKLKLNHSFVFCFLNEFHTVVSIISSWGEESSISHFCDSIMCSGMVITSCSTRGTCNVNHVLWTLLI